jgi:hypothetical protein
MRRKRYRIVIILILLVIGFAIGMRMKETAKIIGLKVNKWDNIYEEKNIKLYYNNSDKQVLTEISEKYSLDKIISGSTDELDKSIKILSWINNKMKYKSDIKSNGDNKGTFDILGNESKKDSYSDEEISIVFNELALAAGITSRIGTLTASNEEKNKVKDSINICEIWSDKYNKWIMIDPSNGNYILEKDIPMSAVEVIDSNLDNLKVIGRKSESKYKKDIVKYLQAYTIKIDNGIYGIGKSNSYICYSKDISTNKIPISLNLNQPTIFLNDTYLFNLSPKKDYKVENIDKIPTIIFSNKGGTKSKDENVKMELVAGVFKNSSMVEKYYISINNGPYKEENKYFTIEIKSGINTIKLSEDGKTTLREIVFEHIDKK